MKYEEPMKIWAMKEIKDVVNYELDNARKGQTTKIKLCLSTYVRSGENVLRFFGTKIHHID